MQSHQDSFGSEASKRYGHRRTPSMGKAMPVTSLLLNFPPPSMSSLRSNQTRDGYSAEQERPPLYFPVDETTQGIKQTTADDTITSDDETNAEQEYELLVSECSSHSDDRDEPPRNHEENISLIGNSTFYTPCLTCTDNAPAHLGNRESAINEMCRRLCTEECRLRLSLAGFVPPSEEALKSQAVLSELVRDSLQRAPLTPTANDDASPPLPPPRPPPSIAIQRKQFLSDMLVDDSNTDSEQDNEHEATELLALISSVVVPRPAQQDADDKKTDAVADPHELAMLKDFRGKFEIAEALAKTSALTSTAKMKRRLAARKLEIDMDGAAAAETAAGACDDNAARQGAARDDGASEIGADTAATKPLNDFEPPRDLLLYLVRMGSFNSAPKINNVDSQDDSLQIPKGLSTKELLQHVKHLRGEHQPPLLTRYFANPTLGAQMAPHDITDGLRSLKLTTVSRDYGLPTTSPNHIRLLQWNILSQTLGQYNDGFIRCPEEALTWENRKFLIVQEILQNNPDIVCLQEVDHFKFLQNILGTQNYDGIFFPKPDSPCLYIEENNGPDGCAIFYKRDKYELKSYDTRILEVWRVQSNQVAIAANLLNKASGKEVCVCTTHLKARHGSLLAKLRNEQGRDLIRFVKQFAGERPLLLCGDFNAEPVEPVYTTILNCDIVKLASAYAEIKAERDECNNDSTEAEAACDKVQKSMQCEPAYTTWKIREEGEQCHTIDYVFYTQEHFKVKNCLEFPHGDEIGKNRTPSFQYPSDHFSLVCDFELTDK